MIFDCNFYANMSECRNLQILGHVLWMSVNADTKFQVGVCPFDKVAALNVH